jgi:hypothetical protein
MDFTPFVTTWKEEARAEKIQDNPGWFARRLRSLSAHHELQAKQRNQLLRRQPVLL